MKLNRFPDFGKEVRRPFEVHENCSDCAGFYDGCQGWPDSRPFDCHSVTRLPDVPAGTCGQRFPATVRKLAAIPEDSEGRPGPDRTREPERAEQSPKQTGTHSRRGDPEKWRKYMRGYMKRRRTAPSKSEPVSGVP